jgi:2-dehydro-3-deoxygalactonokinase
MFRISTAGSFCSLFSESMTEMDWIAVDWGTTRLRAWRMGADGSVLESAQSERGMSTVSSPAEYEEALLELISDWLIEGEKLDVVACGMVGSQQGWIEVPYAAVPCRPVAALTNAPVRDTRIAVSICAGVMQQDPADVMRGEETQVAGLLVQHPNFEGAVCLPGTHCKWVRISDGKIVGFQTFLTGEMYALLAEKSVLCHTVAGEGWQEEVFLEALEFAMGQPEAVMAKLFALRAEALVNELDGAMARSRLTGYLLGWELLAARQWWSDGPMVILGRSDLAKVYRKALKACSVEAECLDAEALTLAGLGAAHRDKI